MNVPGVVWVAVAVAVLVFLDVLVVELRRCARELGTIRRRIAAYRDLPIVSLAASAPADVSRAAAALAAIPPLLARAEAALAALRPRR